MNDSIKSEKKKPRKKTLKFNIEERKNNDENQLIDNEVHFIPSHNLDQPFQYKDKRIKYISKFRMLQEGQNHDKKINDIIRSIKQKQQMITKNISKFVPLTRKKAKKV